MVTDGARYDPVFMRLGITHIVRCYRMRNRVERWIQKLKRRIDTFYASFTGHDIATTNNWFRQFDWVWNVCLRERCHHEPGDMLVWLERD